MATNVPDDVRAMWTDLYRFFDTHYLMNTSSVEAWTEFWQTGADLTLKHEKIPCTFDFVNVIAEMLTKIAAGRKKT